MSLNPRSKHYMTDQVVNFQYLRAKESSALEIAVTNVWSTILRRYFPTFQGYSVDHEQTVINIASSSEEGSKKDGRADVTVARLLMQGMKYMTVVMLEAKRNEYKSQDKRWEKATTQVVDYARTLQKKSGRARERIGHRPIYLLVAVGTWVRFYILNENGELRDFDQDPVKFLELMKHEQRIHEILGRIHQLVEATV